jgi:WXG100 family type VII secretion target
MSNIRISPEQMRTRAQEFGRDAETFQEQIQTMEQRTNALADEWEGQASQRYIQQFGELKPSFEKMHELMETISQQLNQTAQIMEQTDQEIASKLGLQ